MATSAVPQRPTSANWDLNEMCAWLQSLDDRARSTYPSTGAWVCAQPVTWTNQHMKDGWQGYEVAVDQRYTMDRVLKIPKHKAKTWVIFFDTPPDSYVDKTLTREQRDTGTHQWDLGDNHAWATAVVNAKANGYGKHVYIFDCDQEIPDQARAMAVKDLTTQRQRKFVYALTNGNISVVGVFVGNRGSRYSGLGQCVSEATRWVEEIAAADGVSVEENSSRFDGFVELRL